MDLHSQLQHHGNTIARRDGSGHLTVNDLTGDQGIFNNTGTSILQLGGGSGINLGKATTNQLSLKGRNTVLLVTLNLVMIVMPLVGMELIYHTIMFTSVTVE